MAKSDRNTNDIAQENKNEQANGLLPGTTFPETPKETDHAPQPISPPQSFDGPTINGRPTTTTLLSPAQLKVSPLYTPLCNTINTAFRSQAHDAAPAATMARLQYPTQLLDELGTDAGTFTYVLTYAGDVIATASGKRYTGHRIVSVVQKGDTFKRLGAVPAGTEAWELSTMGVAPEVQRRGLADYLMRLTEEEVKRRFVAANGVGGRKLVFMLTAIEEVNGEFYARRGFGVDYRVRYEKGHLGSALPFAVVHMSREVRVGEASS